MIIMIGAVLVTVAVMGWVFYLVIRRYLAHEQKQQMLQSSLNSRAETQRVITPIRLQAYERMALFLERIAPSSLILRCYTPGMDKNLLQGVMTKNVRDEWEHNLSQQIYLTSEAWERIRIAKDEVINMINTSAVALPEDADPQRLAANIFAAQDQCDLTSALEYLKKELREL